MVHRSSAFGKDYITSHFAAHTELATVRYNKNSHALRTDATAPYPLAFKRFIAFLHCISSYRDRRGSGGNKKSCLVFRTRGAWFHNNLVSNTPYALLLNQRYLLSTNRFRGASFRFERKSTLADVGAMEIQRLRSGGIYTHTRFA